MVGSRTRKGFLSLYVWSHCIRRVTCQCHLLNSDGCITWKEPAAIGTGCNRNVTSQVTIKVTVLG